MRPRKDFSNQKPENLYLRYNCRLTFLKFLEYPFSMFEKYQYIGVSVKDFQTAKKLMLNCLQLDEMPQYYVGMVVNPVIEYKLQEFEEEDQMEKLLKPAYQSENESEPATDPSTRAGTLTEDILNAIESEENAAKSSTSERIIEQEQIISDICTLSTCSSNTLREIDKLNEELETASTHSTCSSDTAKEIAKPNEELETASTHSKSTEEKEMNKEILSEDRTSISGSAHLSEKSEENILNSNEKTFYIIKTTSPKKLETGTLQERQIAILMPKYLKKVYDSAQKCPPETKTHFGCIDLLICSDDESSQVEKLLHRTAPQLPRQANVREMLSEFLKKNEEEEKKKEERNIKEDSHPIQELQEKMKMSSNVSYPPFDWKGIEKQNESDNGHKDGTIEGIPAGNEMKAQNSGSLMNPGIGSSNLKIKSSKKIPVESLSEDDSEKDEPKNQISELLKQNRELSKQNRELSKQNRELQSQLNALIKHLNNEKEEKEKKEGVGQTKKNFNCALKEQGEGKVEILTNKKKIAYTNLNSFREQIKQKYFQGDPNQEFQLWDKDDYQYEDELAFENAPPDCLVKIVPMPLKSN